MPNSPSMAMMAIDNPQPNAQRGPSRLPPIHSYSRKARLCRPPAAAPTVGRRDTDTGPPFNGTVVDWSGRAIEALQMESAVECRMCHGEIHPERLP